MTRRMDDFAFTRYSTPALACSFVSDSSILPLSRRTNHLGPIWGRPVVLWSQHGADQERYGIDMKPIVFQFSKKYRFFAI